MNNDDYILNEVLQRVKSDFSLKEKGARLEKGRCPACKKNELYTYKATPWILTCGRADNCGEKISVRDHYPDIFDSWSNRFKASEAQPNAAADAYLAHKRGLNLTGMQKAYTQESYVNGKLSTATVRFALPNDGWWERLIDQPGRFDRKARFKFQASYSGYWWQGPKATWEALARANDVWICEGIFDAWALQDRGIMAVSAMSCNNWPEKALSELRRTCAALGVKTPRLVFAFDVGKAGTEYTRKFVALAEKEGWQATAAQPRPEGETEKLDWNDLKLLDLLKDEDIKDYLWNGRILLAETAVDKAVLLYEKHEWTSFAFVHKSKTYWAHFDAAKIKEMAEEAKVKLSVAAGKCATVTEIANCSFRTLYWQRDETVDESQYFVRIDFPHSNKPFKASFSGGAITAASEFKKRLASVTPGGLFEGNTRQIDRIFSQQNRKLKTVQLLDFMGYSREHEAWVFDQYAVTRGRVVKINEEDYFDLGTTQLKLRSRERTLDIDYDADSFETKWLPPLWIAFRENGMVALTFWNMAFFAEQIRRELKSLGFLEMIGLPGTGKTTLIEFLWKLCGRENYEGFDPAKSTLAAYTRNLSRIGNLPAVFMEADRGEDQPHSKKFDWDEIKPLYNGRIGRARGVKNSGNETYEPPFRGALVVEQNYAVNGSPAVMQRLMQLSFNKDGWSEATKAAATEIETWPAEEISGTIIHVIKREEVYLAKFKAAYPVYLAALKEKHRVRDSRIRHNHAQLHAGLEALAAVMAIPADIKAATHTHIARMAVTRDRALESDHEIVAQFWERFDYLEEQELEGSTNRINQHRNRYEFIAINLTEFEARCRKLGLALPSMDLLKKHLRTSKSRPFVKATTVNTLEEGGKHCWVFQHPDAVSRKKGA